MTRVLIIGALDAELGQAARIAAARGARVTQAEYLLIPGIGQAGGKASAKPLTRPWGF